MGSHTGLPEWLGLCVLLLVGFECLDFVVSQESEDHIPILVDLTLVSLSDHLVSRHDPIFRTVGDLDISLKVIEQVVHYC